MLLALILAEPTGSPKNVKIHWTYRTSAYVSWKAIPCHHQNGRILRYLVKYDYELPNGTFVEQQSETSSWNSLGITFNNLLPNSNYSLQVAGVNDAGVGPFSPPLQLVTRGGRYQQTRTST